MAKQNESIAREDRGGQRLGQRFTLLADSRAVTFVAAVLFTLGMLYHYILPLSSLLYATGLKGQDCGQMIWNIWFANEAITSGHSPFSTNLLFYPVGANLAHHTLAAGFFPITFLVKLLSGKDPMYPIYAYKIIVLLSVALILWFSYLILRELKLTRWAASIAAVGYAFSDFYMLHLLHINHLAGFFIPLTALFLIRAFKNPASLNLMMAAFVAGCSIYFTEFTIYICMAVGFFALVAGSFKVGRRELAIKVRETGPKRLLSAALLFAVIVAPFAITLFKDQVIKPPPSDSSTYSANLAGFFIPGQVRDESERDGSSLTTPLYGRTFGFLNSRVTVGVGGFETFVGFPFLLFGLIAIVKSKEKWLKICAIVSLLFFLLSLGPTLKVFGTETGVPLPYSVLMRIPPFDTGRTPVRFMVMGLFLLMIVAAWGIAWTETFLAERLGGRWSSLAMVLIFAWTTAEVYSATPHRPSFVPPRDLQQRVTGPVFNIPLRAVDGYAALLQVFHRQPIATGYIARDSVERRQRFEQLKQVYDRGGLEFCDRISAMGFQSIVVTRGEVLVPLELAQCKLPVIDLRSEMRWEPDDSVGKNDMPQFPKLAFGQRVDFAAATADEYLWYGWSGQEATARWTDRGSAAIVFSLPELRTAELHLDVAGFVAPPRLVRQRVWIKLNGHVIASLMLYQPEQKEYSFMLPESYLRKENVISFELPDAESPKALGVSEDGRLLGISVRSMRID